ncbi:hypothetical protein GCM10010182_24670 [Actinomadura cremea]|nr:hypothetical protein GCM10010182_24670 [Actinomadura cremea]
MRDAPAVAAALDASVANLSFWTVCVPAVAATFALAIIVRRRIARGTPLAREPHPYEAAMLEAGEKRTVLTALTVLRIQKAIDADGPGAARVTETSRPAGGPLDDALHEAVRQGCKLSDLPERPEVRAALKALRHDLERSGLLLTPAQHARRRRAALPVLVAAVASALTGLTAFVSGAMPVALLVVALVIHAPLSITLMLLLTDPWARTVEGTRALRAHAGRHAHLNPSNSPSWATYGLSSAAVGVALFGTAALASADPDFAAATEIEKVYGTGAAASGGGCGGGACSGCGGCGGCGG